MKGSVFPYIFITIACERYLASILLLLQVQHLKCLLMKRNLPIGYSGMLTEGFIAGGVDCSHCIASSGGARKRRNLVCS